MKAMKLFFVCLMLTSPLCAKKDWKPYVKKQVQNLVKNILKKGDISSYKTEKAISREYDEAINRATNAVLRLTEKADSLVFVADIEDQVMSRIKRKLEKSNLNIEKISSSLVNEFHEKSDSIMSRLKRLVRYHDDKYVTKEEVIEAINWEIDSYFIKKIKDAGNVSPGFFESISNAWSNFINSIEPESNNTNNTNNTSSTNDPTRITIYYAEPCVVCQENYYGEERVGALNCGHTFHPECIKEWLKQSKTCPLCRKENVYLAKIYDSKEHVPGYTPPAQPAPQVEPVPPVIPIPEPTISMPLYFDGNCSVCISDFYGEERVGVLNCGHCFHPDCIKPWLAQSKTCPLCRKENAYLAKIYDSKDDVPRQ